MSLLDKLFSIIPKFKSEEKAEYYFALNIEPEILEASVWGVERKKLRIINTSTQKYQSEDELTRVANFVLDNALADYTPEPSKILFGVPDSWLQDEDLKPEYLKLLRNMVKDLDVTPMAYVSITHAISHYLQKMDGVPVTAILVDISDPLLVTVVKAGKIIGTKMQRRTGNLPEDVEKALLTFSDVEVLPSKILIYGSLETGLEKFKQELLTYSWMSQLPFLHLPRVDVLEEGISLKAISFAGASEINPDINIHPGDLDVETVEVKHKVSRPLTAENENLEDLGFVAGDIEKIEKSKVQDDKVGIEGDIDEGLETAVPMPIQRRVAVEDYDEYPLSRRGVSGPDIFTSDSIKSNAANFLSYSKFLLIPVLILVFLFVAALFLPKAKVTVYVDPRTLEKEALVVADPTLTMVDEANKKIPGKTVETDVSGSSKAGANGKKKVGDPAKGSVIIYNKTSGQKPLSSGTQLVGPNNMIFTLDNSVNVASQSAVEGGISFGKENANVTAAVIGPDGNLPAGKELSIKGQPTDVLSAKVDTAFSGGVSKDVTVVTSDDQKKLLAQLSSDLRKQASETIQGKLTSGLKVLPEGLQEKIVKQNFSKNVNDQAQEFGLNLTVNYRGTAYNENDLKLIVSKLVETNVPEGYKLDLAKTETQSDVSKIEKDGRLIFNAKFKAKLMPKLDVEKIKKEIAFKTPSEMVVKLKSYENVIGGDVKMNPSLPGPLSRLPFLAKNITIEISTK